ncbi:hypothetical protein SAMD00079811_31280 [Scytonema sp. HK-05]|uniref:hypothetical protein n=1 Tax=Scytonema sp. HK-05 TaxID=1137095 RepID=UPI000937DFDB|nr:hypothetical protein [Scytonema sp. HK-05]OKH51769.1 hypothetical protein NIES2130_33200 [Scytonema sp. HK-05]BAY45524.1 hypothetical protein SAMD00079811_31280 [Scytonema sp. HK-05]
MLFLTPEDLENQGVFCKEASQIIFQNKILTRFIDFPTQNRRRAIKFCQEFLEDQLFCLLVENQSYLTVWVEKKQVRLTGETEIPINYVQPVSNSLSSQAKDKPEKAEIPINRVQPVSTSLSSQAQDKADVQTQLKSRGSVYPQGFTPASSPKDEKYSDSNPIKEQGEFDIPLSESPTEDKASTKKPTKRYRGVSY